MHVGFYTSTLLAWKFSTWRRGGNQQLCLQGPYRPKLTCYALSGAYREGGGLLPIELGPKAVSKQVLFVVFVDGP